MKQRDTIAVFMHYGWLLAALLLAVGLGWGTGVASAAEVTPVSNPPSAQHESPSAGSYESGIGLIRGWVCNASRVEIEIDGGERRLAAYGTKRGDTATVCGDTDNGYGLTFNWNALGDGPHKLRAFADGVEFGNVVFHVTTLGQDFLQGAHGDYTLSDFPQAGSILKLHWSEAHQNFVVAGYAQAGAYTLFGLDFSPYLEGQSPNLGTVVPEAQLRERMEIVRPHTRWIRTFGSTNGLEKSGTIAHDFKLKIAMGARIGADRNANEREIAGLIAAGQRGEADILIVGSEVLLRNDLSEAELIDYLNRVKQQVPGRAVAYADVYSEWLQRPALIEASDLVLANYYPYWEGIGIDHAMAALHCNHQRVVAAANGKPIIVSETGWPSAGNTIGAAVPNADNAAFYFLNFVSWARANAVDYFYFEAFDESWKATPINPQEAHWGVWDQGGALKPGMQAVFDGKTLPANWGAGCEPAIEFTHVPPYGSSENLQGRVLNVDPANYRVAVYINVRGGWWTKPYSNDPLTSIQSDGTWVCDITTGGVDNIATRIAAFLVPKGYDPPLLSGAGTLPAELAQHAVAQIEVSRQP
ncbi:MAG: glycosyl hydrolase family 17 protein [Candidatus Contendobacter sp.]|nr:glycosyl hydrolase family 17 protein [Candidatus Contendobacter sp.]